MKKRTPLVSAVIPAYNEERYIKKCLESLSDQSYPKLEILVVDDGSRDETVKIVKRFRKVKLINGEHRGPGFSRNLGAKRARGEILIFVDADMAFDKDYVSNLVAPLVNDKKIIGTTHDYEVATNTENIWSKLWGRVRVPRDPNYWKRIVIFRAIRRKNFLELGGFDPSYGYADDQSLWIKYGIRPLVAMNTTCYHRNPESLKETYKQSRWIGASIQSFFLDTAVIQHISVIFLTLLSPLAILIISVKKSFQNENWKLFFPWMILFVGARYYGTLSGVIRKIYLNKNYK